ncbi:hypothetical protein [Streptomyces sp. NBC_01643]|uniref:hypothetical protein n=1 Tax=Streptomyces sp. NBC_01643 TaxID=2975906 RepID=UPI002F912128|nr:hypothetical protein OHB03_46525 [Streptomyces sp. NBC_01643]
MTARSAVCGCTIVAQAVDELRQGPLPAADNTAAEDSDDALERALADAERHPTDMRVVRRLVDEMVAAGGKLGQTALELAPAYLSDQEAADTVLARYANDIGCDVDTTLATRRYALTSDHRGLCCSIRLGSGTADARGRLARFLTFWW